MVKPQVEPYSGATIAGTEYYKQQVPDGLAQKLIGVLHRQGKQREQIKAIVMHPDAKGFVRVRRCDDPDKVFDQLMDEVEALSHGLPYLPTEEIVARLWGGAVAHPECSQNRLVVSVGHADRGEVQDALRAMQTRGLITRTQTHKGKTPNGDRFALTATASQERYAEVAPVIARELSSGLLRTNRKGTVWSYEKCGVKEDNGRNTEGEGSIASILDGLDLDGLDNSPAPDEGEEEELTEADRAALARMHFERRARKYRDSGTPTTPHSEASPGLPSEHRDGQPVLAVVQLRERCKQH